jgi:uncharacterized protein (TIGR03437 family)
MKLKSSLCVYRVVGGSYLMRSVGGSFLMRSKVLKSAILLACLLLLFVAEQSLQAQQDVQVPANKTVLVADGGAVSWSVNNLISYAQINGTGGSTGYWNVRTINPDGTSDTCITCPLSPGAGVFPPLSKGAPVWSADGKFIIFQAQAFSLGSGVCNGNSTSEPADINDGPAFPGEGSWNDLWATDMKGTFYKLTNQATYGEYVACGGSYSSGGGTCTMDGTQVVTYSGGGATTNAAGTIQVSGGVPSGAITLTAGGSFYTSVPTTVSVAGCPGAVTISGAVLGGMGGVIYPTLSWDGTKLAWGQRLINNEPGTKAAQNTSVWELAIGTFSESGGIPALTDIQYYKLGTGDFPYVEPRSWSADNSTVFFMGSLSGEPGSVKNIYSFNSSTGALLNLTHNNFNWNEYPVALPPSFGSNKIIYMMYPLVGPVNPTCVSDYWVMNYDGTDNYQLTFFNNPFAANFVPAVAGSADQAPGGVCMDTHSWSPDGKQLVVYNNTYAANGQSGVQGPDWIMDVAPANPTVNAASYQTPPLAANTIVSIFGTNLANATLVASTAALPTNLANSTVSVMDAKGVARPATLYFVSAGQINIVVPDATSQGPAVVTVTNPQGVQSSSTVNIGTVSPAFYTMNQTGSGVVAAYVQVVPASGPQVYEPVYSCPGGRPPCTTIPINVSNSSDRFYLVLFGTGLRGRSALGGVSVTIGNQSVPVLYVGAQGQYEGFDQMVVQLPKSLAGAGVVNVVATVDGAMSNAVQIQLQ